MLALALVAVSVGFSNLAASIAIGVGGVSAATRLRVLLTFGLFEAGMPIVGLLIGHDLASDIGREARLLGSVLLIGVGGYGIVSFLRKIRVRDQPVPVPAPEGPDEPEAAAGSSAGSASDQPRQRREWVKVGVSAFALSLDNLIAGFALGGYQVNLLTGALVFGIVSIGMSLAGLEFGARLGGLAGESGELIGGVVLVGVGLAIGLGLIG